MIQYIIECLAFQLLFLVVYDVFLKRETFFQWNRAYLIITFVLSMLLPWIKIEALKTTVSEDFVSYPVFLWQLEGVELSTTQPKTNWLASLPTEYIIFGLGVIVSGLYFVFKLNQIYSLKKKGTIRYYQDFTKVVIKKSEVAFSFFKNIFLGEEIQKENENNIIAHELVHIKQWHSLDLLFFEIMRIAFWFNPLVYVYQKKVSELHEFIADSAVAKTDKKGQYQTLLAEAFQTDNISFVNQFFKKSLIKKRIVMISKERSKKIYQFKYLLLVPLVLGMLVYTSCELDNKETSVEAETPLKVTVEQESVPFAIVDEVPIFPGCENAVDKKACFQEKINEHIRKNFNYPIDAQESGIQGRVLTLFIIGADGKIKNIKMRGPDKLLETEVKRIVERLPQMQPGRQDGKAVNVPFSIPVTFKLAGTSSIVDKDGLIIVGYNGPKEKKNVDSVPFTLVDEVPIFPGCENAADKKACFQESMKNHIKKHFNYPDEAQELGVQGRVSLLFMISKDGSIKKIRKRGPHELLENEAVRIIERLPKMQPGKHEGKEVDVPFAIPITFKLN
ncbi:M56 family metallopeptidase [Croceitalea sp. MTPC9]|uniref:M56 family metallopeptidase n=1 Tax=unclassified Croceitalea TaxID=2632280 RepID=UPI002B39EBD2|nr:M56 family metallopeptidase [Croceitalea sp. MTPC6]GMN17651.1 M56 family metallopeptidase [Croceitalea sp. MTPC9]